MPTKKQASKTSSTKAGAAATTQSKKHLSGGIIKTVIVGLEADPPIIVTGGSVDIDINEQVFPRDPKNPNKCGNSNKHLLLLEITDKATPPNVLMAIDLTTMNKGKCRIVVNYK